MKVPESMLQMFIVRSGISIRITSGMTLIQELITY